VELLAVFADFVLHLDEHLQIVAQDYGVWIYLILFVIVFCETGLVVTPFLPGDSLLFVAGALAAGGMMYVHGLFVLLLLAAFGGDNTNYWIGRYLGPRVFRRERSRLFNPAHLQHTHRFYERHGGKTMIFARFMPVVRTFAPFIAGIGRMHYARFVVYSFAGNVFWVGGFVFGGYYFGSIPVIRENLTALVLGIIGLSLLPPALEFLRQKKRVRA
jgi:membrane-associated protein